MTTTDFFVLELGVNNLRGPIPPIPYEGCATFPNPFSSFMSRIYRKKYAKVFESSLEALSLCKCYF